MNLKSSAAILFISILFLAGCSQQPAGSASGNRSIQNATFSITLGAPQRLFSPGQFDTKYIPDEHIPVLQLPDKGYHVFFTGLLDHAHNFSTLMFYTKDFIDYSPVVGNATHAKSVFEPSCDGANLSCIENFDADYAGADFVYPASDGKDLLMVYHGENHRFGGVHSDWGAGIHFYATVGLARSSDGGVTWKRQGAIISSSDPKPQTAPVAAGVSLPGGIISGDYAYVFYTYLPSTYSYEDAIEVARSPLSGDGAPGTWMKYYNGSFSQPGLGGLGSSLIPSGTCMHVGQPWPGYSTYLKKYVLVFLCNQNSWAISTSSDLVNWTQPAVFYQAPGTFYVKGQETDEYVTLVTPGEPGGVIGQSGYVLYANSSDSDTVPTELFMRPFNFTMNE